MKLLVLKEFNIDFRPLSKIDIFYTGSTKNLAERKSIPSKSIVDEEEHPPKNQSQLYLSTIGLPTVDDYVDTGFKAWVHKYLNVSIWFRKLFNFVEF